MLALFSLAALLTFCVVGTLVGWRIGRLARAGGGAPERWIALCLLGICCVGYPVLLVSQALPTGALRVVALSFGIGAIDAGIAAIFLFTRSVFRADSPRLRPLVALFLVALAVHWVGSSASLWAARASSESLAQVGVGWTLLSTALSSAGFSWTAAESLHFWRLARRRLALGLADPLVASRALLWGLVGVSSTAINAANVVAILAGRNLLQDAPTMIATGTLGLLNAVALWLAFLPPEAWVRWVRRTASAAPGAA